MSADKQRCLGCHNWTATWAICGKYYPWKAIPKAPRGLHAVYFLCPKCAAKVQKGGRIARRVTDNVEGYLNQDLREAMALAGMDE